MAVAHQTGSSRAESGSRWMVAWSIVRSAVAGQLVADRSGQCGPYRLRPCGPRGRWRAPGAARSSAGMVTVMALAGTASMSGKWPSLTCCARQASSSSTTLTSSGSVEVGHRGIVEGQVPVLPDPEAAQVERVALQELGVARALGPGVAQTLDVVGSLGVGRLDDPLADPALEAGRVVGSHPDVLVHVEDHRLGPGHVRGCAPSSAAMKASWEFPVANMACATPRAATAARMTSAA